MEKQQFRIVSDSAQAIKKDKSYYVTYRLLSDVPDLYDTVINPLGCENVRQKTPLKNIGMDTSHYDADKEVKESTFIDIAGEPMRIWNEIDSDSGTPYLMGEVRFGKNHYITDSRGNKLMTSFEAYEQGIIKGVSVQFNDKPFRATDTVRSSSGRITYNRYWLTRISVLVSTTGDLPGQPTSGEVSATLRQLKKFKNDNNNTMFTYKEGDILTANWQNLKLTGELTEFADEAGDSGMARIEGKLEDGQSFEITLPYSVFSLAEDQTNRCMLCEAKKKRAEEEQKRVESEAEAQRIADQEAEASKLADESKLAEQKRVESEAEAKRQAENNDTTGSDITMLKEAVTSIQTAMDKIRGQIDAVTTARNEESRQLEELQRSFLNNTKPTPQVRKVEPKVSEDVMSVFEAYGSM
jgi:hypothetical protein